MVRQDQRYAVAVRDAELYLFLRIKRNPKGEIFAMIPMKSPEERNRWNPHASKHESGQRHDKSYKRPFGIRHGQPANSTFRGEEYLMARPIAAHEPRAFESCCQPDKFDKVFEIPVDLLSPETYRTAIEVDLAETQDRPILPCNLRDRSDIINQAIFQDAVPWIVVTLYDMGPLTVGNVINLSR